MLSLIKYLAKIYYWAKSYCHGLAPGDSYLATIYDGGVNSFLNAKMNEWIPDGDHVSSIQQSSPIPDPNPIGRSTFTPYSLAQHVDGYLRRVRFTID